MWEQDVSQHVMQISILGQIKRQGGHEQGFRQDSSGNDDAWDCIRIATRPEKQLNGYSCLESQQPAWYSCLHNYTEIWKFP